MQDYQNIENSVIPYDQGEIEKVLKQMMYNRGITDVLYEGSNVSQLSSVISYVISSLNINTAINLQETLLPLATKRMNVLFGARQLGYEARPKVSYTYDLLLRAQLSEEFTIVDLDGNSSLFSNAIFNLDMYAVVYHRNHLGVLSANPLTLSAGKYTYNFTSGEAQAYGGNLGHKLIGSGVWGLASGDCDADGNVHLNDKNNIWENAAGTKDYLSGDANLDGQTDNKDKNDKILNNIDRYTQIPD